MSITESDCRLLLDTKKIEQVNLDFRLAAEMFVEAWTENPNMPFDTVKQSLQKQGGNILVDYLSEAHKKIIEDREVSACLARGDKYNARLRIEKILVDGKSVKEIFVRVPEGVNPEKVKADAIREAKSLEVASQQRRQAMEADHLKSYQDAVNRIQQRQTAPPVSVKDFKFMQATTVTPSFQPMNTPQFHLSNATPSPSLSQIASTNLRAEISRTPFISLRSRL